MTGPTKFPRPYVALRKPGQRKKDHGARSRESEWKAYQAAWSKPIDEIRPPSGDDFFNLRRNVLVLNRHQCARLLRVGAESILNWESGRHGVPFYAYLALLLVSESQHYRLSNAKWRDWQFIERGETDSRLQYAKRGSRGKAREHLHITELVNPTSGAHFTPDELERFHALRSEAAALQSEALLLRQRVDELVSENAQIREQFRVDGITSGLHLMYDKVQAMLAKVNTAEVVKLPRKAANASTEPQQRAVRGAA